MKHRATEIFLSHFVRSKLIIMNIVETTKKKRIVEFKYWNLGKKKTREK
jgi:hypothetical protein